MGKNDTLYSVIIIYLRLLFNKQSTEPRKCMPLYVWNRLLAILAKAKRNSNTSIGLIVPFIFKINRKKTISCTNCFNHL